MEKIINIGSHKTGSYSLIEALEILGFKSCPEFYYNDENYYFNHFILKKNIKGLFNYIKESPYNLYEDSPYNFKNIYRKLYEYDNNFKFILTIREENSWFDSLLYSTYENGKIDKSDNITLQYLYGLVNEENKNKIINIYNKRNEEIKNFFKGNLNFCIINLSDPDIVKWKKLTDFLNVPNKFENLKKLKYPCKNKRVH